VSISRRIEVRRLSIVALVVIVLCALLAPYIAPFDPAAQLDIASLKNSAPSLRHWLGTDSYSRDLLSRLLFGARTSLVVGSVATIIALALGTAWGGTAALAGKRAGAVMMLTVDVMRSVPRILLFLVAVALAGTLSPLFLAIVLGVAAWPVIARLTYTFAREATGRDFVEAARAVGSTRWSVLSRHVAPHLVGPLTAAGALLLADVLAVESGLSFLGIGVRPPAPSWGNMVQDALPYLGSAPWVAAVPCLALLVTVMAVTTLADAAYERRASQTRARSNVSPRLQ
jgi:peptide/nickel transport system permease protein